MKFIGKLLLYILIALLVVIAGLYFLLQTRWGAEHISAWVSENSDYHLAFGAMDHRFSAPSHIVLKNVTFDELSMQNWEAEQPGTYEVPFSFAGADYTDKIDATV